MKAVFTIFNLCLFCGLALAHNGSIRGSVQDAATKNPLAGAVILIENTQQQTYTDELGFYQFTNLEAGSYKLVIRYLGYETIEEIVDVRDSETSYEAF